MFLFESNCYDFFYIYVIMSFNGIKANSDGTSLVQIKQDGYFPADLLFLSSTNPDGVCYIEVHIH